MLLWGGRGGQNTRKRKDKKSLLQITYNINMHKSCEIESCQDIVYFVLEQDGQDILVCDYHKRNLEGNIRPYSND